MLPPLAFWEPDEKDCSGTMTIYTITAQIQSSLVRSLHDWWLAKCGNDVPDRADLDPAELKPLLRNLFITDVEHEPFRIRYRLLGTRAIEATGMDITGHYLDELLPADHTVPWMEYYQRSYRSRQPLFGAVDAPT